MALAARRSLARLTHLDFALLSVYWIAIGYLWTSLGGLILPFPFWPIGAIVALFSRLWDIKDKSLAVTGPLLVTLALSAIAAPFVGGSGNVIVVYFHAIGVSFGLLVRVGSVITAAAPYAPSTCSHAPSSPATSASPAMSSIIPAFVVPAVATIAAIEAWRIGVLRQAPVLADAVDPAGRAG